MVISFKGTQVQKPPTAVVAAQVVSRVLQSASISQSVAVKHDSSTDTDDSDDSEIEAVSALFDVSTVQH